jgi:hypothetical protein
MHLECIRIRQKRGNHNPPFEGAEPPQIAPSIEPTMQAVKCADITGIKDVLWNTRGTVGWPRAVMEAPQEEIDHAANARSIGVTVRSTMTSRGYVVVMAGCDLTTLL